MAAQQAYKMAGITRVRRRLRRGPRLLHLDRDLEHRGPRLLREGRGPGPGARGAHRAERRHPDQPERRPQVVRPSDRRQRRAHDLRVRHPAARPGRRAAGQEPGARPGPQRRRARAPWPASSCWDTDPARASRAPISVDRGIAPRDPATSRYCTCRFAVPPPIERLSTMRAVRRWRAVACIAVAPGLLSGLSAAVSARATGERRPSMSGGGVDRKRIVILLRSVVIATCAYLVLQRQDGSPAGRAALRRGVRRLERRPGVRAARAVLHGRTSDPCLLLADTAVILFGMSWSHGLSQDLLLAYFFTIFLITIGETLGQVAIGSALIAAVYGYWLWISGSAIAGVRGLGAPAVLLPGRGLLRLADRPVEARAAPARARRRARTSTCASCSIWPSVFSETHATREFVQRHRPLRRGHLSGPALPHGAARRATRCRPSASRRFPLRAHGRVVRRAAASRRERRARR